MTAVPGEAVLIKRAESRSNLPQSSPLHLVLVCDSNWVSLTMIQLITYEQKDHRGDVQEPSFWGSTTPRRQGKEAFQSHINQRALACLNKVFQFKWIFNQCTCLHDSFTSTAAAAAAALRSKWVITCCISGTYLLLFRWKSNQCSLFYSFLSVIKGKRAGINGGSTNKQTHMKKTF